MSQPSDYQPPYPAADKITEEMSIECFLDSLAGQPPASGDETPGQIMFRALSQNRQSSQLDPAKAIQLRVQHLAEKAKALLASNMVLHHLPLLVAIEGHYFTDKLLTTAADWFVIHRANEAASVRYNATTKQPMNPFNTLVRVHVQGLIGTQEQEEKPF